MKRQRAAYAHPHSFLPTLPMHPLQLQLQLPAQGKQEQEQEQDQDAGAGGSDHQYSRDYLMDLLEVSK